jgi:phosphatidylserine/phosphatidylglycerophosphate/cardiolipin synthase-like enzyme
MPADVAQALRAPTTDAHHPRTDTAAGITWLIDNAEAYAALIDACRTARRSIWITQLAFDADCVAYAAAGEPTTITRIADVLLEASARAVDVRILLNSSMLLDTATPLRAHYAAAHADGACLRIRGISRFPQLLHAKIVVVDGREAFLVGSPFANGYWDDSQHLPTDERRPPRELGGRPLHDLSLRLSGGAATTLGAAFVELWNGADDIAAGDEEPMCAAMDAAPEPDGDVAIRIVQSAPRVRRALQPPERTEILPALLEGLARARRLVYIEHQYLSSLAVIGALRAALDREPGLEVIVVLNQNPDVTAYRGWQNLRLAASGLFDHPRVGLFALWTAAPCDASGRTVINQVFVHSKVVVVDDRWAMVGSANLDGVSLQTYGDDFSGWLGQRVFRGVRNFDVAAVLSATGPTAPAVLELRTALWREHLDAPDLDAEAAPSGGWLAEWRRRAAEHARWLCAGAAIDAPRIILLPYSRSSTPIRQLGDAAGVAFANDGLVVAFDPSWAEVHLSPNWLRNMLA